MLANAAAFTVLPAEDIERAAKFYREVLGLKRAEDVGAELVMFEAGGGTRILIYQRERTKAEHTVLGFMVEDLEATVRGLVARGLTFEQYDFPGLKTNELGIAESDGTLSAWFVDPEGNIVNIASM